MEEQFIRLDESYLEQAAALYKSAFAGEPWNDDWSDEEQLRAYISDIACQQNSLNFGLISGGQLVAIALGSTRHWWEGTNYNLEELCISPDMQGRGIGTRFLAQIESELKALGIAGIFLQTDIDKPSYRFYRKNGFGELTKHVSFFKGL